MASMNDFKDAHVLVVDDDEGSIGVIESLCKQLGVKYTSVMEPGRVLNVLKQIGSVSVVLLDLDMPDLSGYDLLSQLRSVLPSTTPVVVYTSHTAEIVRAKNAGFDGFLGKPLNSQR